MDEKAEMILAKDQVFSMDCKKTQLNNNVLVVGASGCGKTRGIVSPNILMATGSYVISDPKGNLYRKYKEYLESKGYVVQKLDFTNPRDSAHYNCLSYIKEPIDVIKISHMIASQSKATWDPFWDEAACMLLSALISYCIEFLPYKEQNFRSIEKMIHMMTIDENCATSTSELDLLMQQAEKKYPDSFAVRQYKNVMVGAGKTIRSIQITLTSKLRVMAADDISHMMSMDDIDIASLGKQKKALFVVVSDTDRSMDMLANIFFTQAMNELCRYADKDCKDSALPVPVRFILDDFATNCVIDDFPRMISSIRSRGISTTLMIQSESQLEKAYGADKETIIGNCDTYVYLGGSDIETARHVSEKTDMPLRKVLTLPVGTTYIFRRGKEPLKSERLNLEEFEKQVGFIPSTKKFPEIIDGRSLCDKLRGTNSAFEHSSLNTYVKYATVKKEAEEAEKLVTFINSYFNEEGAKK